MAELSIDDLRRLARNFLVGRGGEAELEDTKRAMEQDPQLAMEFLQQMQTALDDVAPAGYSPDQWREIDARVASLIAPLAKSGLGLGFLGKLFSKLFKKKPAATGPARIKRKGGEEPSRPKAAGGGPTSLLSSEAVVAPAMAAPVEGMEEEAPIAAVMPAAPVAAQSAAAAAPDAPEAAASTSRPLAGRLAVLLFTLIVAAALGYGAWKLIAIMKAHKAAKSSASALAVGAELSSPARNERDARPRVAPPTPVPQPTPVPTGGPSRRMLPPATQDEPLPSELPPMTPQPAGKVEKQDGLDANDSEGHTALPLP